MAITNTSEPVKNSYNLCTSIFIWSIDYYVYPGAFGGIQRGTDKGIKGCDLYLCSQWRSTILEVWPAILGNILDMLLCRVL